MGLDVMLESVKVICCASANKLKHDARMAEILLSRKQVFCYVGGIFDRLWLMLNIVDRLMMTREDPHPLDVGQLCTMLIIGTTFLCDKFFQISQASLSNFCGSPWQIFHT